MCDNYYYASRGSFFPPRGWFNDDPCGVDVARGDDAGSGGGARIHGYNILYEYRVGTYACHWKRHLRWRRLCSSTNIGTWLHRPFTGCCTDSRGRLSRGPPWILRLVNTNTQKRVILSRILCCGFYEI